MFSFAPWLPTALAVVLAVIGAFCFASAAFLQQHAVAQALRSPDGAEPAPPERVGFGSFHLLMQQPRWWMGWGLIAAGALLHVSALLLAPISVVQPIGVLAVPIAVVLAARSVHTPPAPGVIAGVALSVAGTGAFVLLAGTGAAAASPPATLPGLLTALALVAAVVIGLEVTSRLRPGLTRCLAYAGIGAVSFGFGSALIRLISRAVSAESAAALSPLVITAGLTMVSALVLGAWAVQQAYASGTAAVVIGALTVGDPLAAILLSAGWLGEGLTHGPAPIAAMIASALGATCGIWLLAQHHPTAVPTPAVEPARVLTTVP